MSAVDQAEKLLSLLSPAEKAQLLLRVARQVGQASAGVESTPGVCGGAPCVVRTRIPIWLLERARQLGTSESQILAAYPTLRAVDLANAWEYVRSHSHEIEQQIRENETDDSTSAGE
jgi:uncharacterized protein (DUF433 family)